MTVTVLEFSEPVHRGPAVEVLQRVRIADPTYPPPDAGTSGTELSAWLMSETGVARWVAIDDNEVVGHVQLTEPHDYLLNHLVSFGCTSEADGGFIEISKLFADPLVQRRGVGTSLLSTARAAAWATDRQPALAVVTTSSAATRMYVRAGMTEVGQFDGIHGINRVMLDPTREAGPDQDSGIGKPLTGGVRPT